MSASDSPRWLSPLRYPGGKGRMGPALADIFAVQYGQLLDIEVWVEPFAGGAGAALWLLENKHLADAWLIERNPALAAFWAAVIDRNEELAQRVEAFTPTLAGWAWAQALVSEADMDGHPDPLDLGVAAFILNRCSRSGMVRPGVGPIGGKLQRGRHTISDRWNGPELAERIRRLAAHTGLRVQHGDAIAAIRELSDSGVEDEVMLFVDPPYLTEGERLYQHGSLNHKALARALRDCPAPWLLTYDADPRVLDLYPGHRVFEYAIPHTANTRGIGREYAVLANNLYLPEDARELLPRAQTRWVQHSA